MCSAGLMDVPKSSLSPFFPGGLTLDSPEADPYFSDSLDLLAQARSQKVKVRYELEDRVEEHSLALLCGFLNPCNKFYFLFLFALFGYLDDPSEEWILPAPFCGNISLDRHRRYYRVINALRQYLDKPLIGYLVDEAVLTRLGDSTKVKTWLVASLEKTLREQTPSPRSAIDVIHSPWCFIEAPEEAYKCEFESRWEVKIHEYNLWEIEDGDLDGLPVHIAQVIEQLRTGQELHAFGGGGSLFFLDGQKLELSPALKWPQVEQILASRAQSEEG
jgi:hypothetical protein